MLKKKIISSILSLALVASLVPQAFAFSDVYDNNEAKDEIKLLSDMNIFSGYTDGTFKPDNVLTRAEFATLVVKICQKEKEAKANQSSSSFSDVKQGKWYVGYINYIADNNIISGYANGTFAPEKQITYAEALTILCRLMGYQEDTVGYFWPDNYINQASVLEITKGLNFSKNQQLTRAKAAILIERCLFADVCNKNGAKDQMLLESLGYTVNEDDYVLETGSTSSSLNAKQVKCASGLYFISDNSTLPNCDTAGCSVLNKDGKLCGIRNENASQRVYVTGMPDSYTVEYESANGTKGTFRFDQNFETYVDYNKSTYAMASSQINVDTELVFCGKSSGQWEYAVVNNDIGSTTPTLITKNYTQDDTYIAGSQINKTNLKVYRNGEEAKLSDIKVNDVAYYNTRTNVIEVYSKKVTGIYANAYPDKAHVTSVKVAGTTYSLASNGTAKQSLGANQSSFAVGDKVTLLFGKNNEVCFAVNLTDFDTSSYGVLIDCIKNVSSADYNDGTSQTVAQILMGDGEIHEYPVSHNYSSLYKGKLVKLTYEGSTVTLQSVSESKLYGTLNTKDYKFAGKNVLKDVKVFVRISDEDATNVEAEIVDFSTLDTTNLTVNQVITTVIAPTFGDIGIMYLENLSSTYKTGYLLSTQVSEMGDISTCQYKIFDDGISTTYSNSASYAAKVRTPVVYKTTGTAVTEMFNMKEIASSTKIDSISGGRIKVSGVVYEIADNCDVVKLEGYNSGTISSMSISDLEEKKVSSVRIFSDVDNGKDSQIRMIIVQ